MEQKEKMEQKRRNLFNNLPADAILPSRRLMRLRWFKVVSRRFAAFNNNSVAWGGAAKGVLAQHYSFLVFRNKKKNKKTKKVGVHYVSYTGKCELKRLYAANKVALLKAHLMDRNVGRSDLIKGVRLQTRKPVFFNVRQATSTLDFNKFFKVNRAVARNMNAISVDLYSQYITNLQASCSASSTIMSQNADKTALGKRALRKYVLLLHHYFNEVYDRKMAKNIPASSAMH